MQDLYINEVVKNLKKTLFPIPPEFGDLSSPAMNVFIPVSTRIQFENGVVMNPLMGCYTTLLENAIPMIKRMMIEKTKHGGI